LSEYSHPTTIYRKGTPIHVKGAILYNHFLKEYDLMNKYPMIQEGEKLKFTYLKSPNPFRDTVVSFPTRLPKEFNLQSYLDYDTQFEKSFIEPVKSILDCVGWKTEKQQTLDAFFG
jgi:DNA polymerase elongation subunit (family B)